MEGLHVLEIFHQIWQIFQQIFHLTNSQNFRSKNSPQKLHFAIINVLSNKTENLAKFSHFPEAFPSTWYNINGSMVANSWPQDADPPKFPLIFILCLRSFLCKPTVSTTICKYFKFIKYYSHTVSQFGTVRLIVWNFYGRIMLFKIFAVEILVICTNGSCQKLIHQQIRKVLLVALAHRTRNVGTFTT